MRITNRRRYTPVSGYPTGARAYLQPSIARGVDYFVVFRSEDDRFSEPINLGPKVNTVGNVEWSASLSPDGKILFFMSSRSVIVDHRAPRPMSYPEVRRLQDLAMNGNSDIWWVDAGFIEALRPDGFR